MSTNKEKRSTGKKDNGGSNKRAKSNDDDFFEEADALTIKRKSIHRALVSNPDGKNSAGNSHQSPYAVIAENGKGDIKYKGRALTFLDPNGWDPAAPSSAGVDGYMRYLKQRSEKDLLLKDGAWRELICFSKQKKGGYTYLGNYEIVTDVDGKLVPMDPPGAPEIKGGKEITKKLSTTKQFAKKNPESKEVEEWIKDPENWKRVPIHFLYFDENLWSTIKNMESFN